MRYSSKEKCFTLRKSVVISALKHGIKPTARKYNMSKNTVRLWLRRFQSEGNNGLVDRRIGSKKVLQKTSGSADVYILKIKYDALN